MPEHYVGVIGPGEAARGTDLEAAERVGELLAAAGHTVLTGGLGGVMEAASRGAARAGGRTVGLLPGSDRGEGNRWLTVGIATGMGEMRNALLVRACDAVICIGGSWGTLSEVALAVRTGVPVVRIGGWELPDAGPLAADSPEEAIALIGGVLGAGAG